MKEQTKEQDEPINSEMQYDAGLKDGIALGKIRGKTETLNEVMKIIDERFDWWAINNVFNIKQWKWLAKELKAKLLSLEQSQEKKQ